MAQSTHGPIGPKNGQVYDELNKLIFEYLEINGLERTVEVFSSECESKSLPCPTSSEATKAAFSQYEATQMMKAFDDGNLNVFFHLWKLFQSHIQVTSDDMGKLEVYIRVHFALYPRAHNQSEEAQNDSMNELKHFFEKQKSTLGKDSAILPLYALPFVEDPFTHPVFKELFRDVWTLKLRSQLESTVSKYFELLQENICQHSRLAELVVKGERYEETNLDKESLTTVNQNDKFYQLLSNHRKIRKLLQGTRESYAKLLLVTHELVTSLEQSISGETIPLDSVVDKCYAIFPEIFTKKDAEDGQKEKPDIDYFKDISSNATFDPTQDSEVSLFLLGISNVSPEFLDYEKIKETLVNGTTASVSDKLCLLQALRWLLTRTTESCRQIAIESFVSADIFGIGGESQSEFGRMLFACFLYPAPTYQKECLARLVNSVASVKAGRDYLSLNMIMVDTLIKSLNTFTGPTESFICQMVVATLQKLSLKKNMRLFMIDHKVIDWLVVFVRKELAEQNDDKSKAENKNNNGNFNPYLMEYAWALLMNLCLHEEAWASCFQNGRELLTSACNMLMITPRKDLAPYVVSTLYSLLRCSEMYALAKEIHLETLVAPILTEETELSEHLNNLISLLYMKGCDKITSSRETNYDDEDSPDPDVFEPEIELTESWTAALEDFDLTGDNLLLRKYLIDQAEPVVPQPKSEKDLLVEPQRSGEIIRPITPANNNGTVTASKGKKASKNSSSTSVEGKSPKKTVTPKNKEPTRTVSRGASTSLDVPASKSISADMKGILKKSSEKVNKGNISKMVGTVQKRKEEIGVKHKKAISGDGNDPTFYN